MKSVQSILGEIHHRFFHVFPVNSPCSTRHRPQICHEPRTLGVADDHRATVPNLAEVAARTAPAGAKTWLTNQQKQRDVTGIGWIYVLKKLKECKYMWIIVLAILSLPVD